MEQLRGFTKSVTIDFDERFTLIIGENGAGKSTILDALRVLLSQSMVTFVKKSQTKKTFDERDVAFGWPFLRAQSVLHTVPTRAAITCDAQKFVSTFTPRQLPDGKPYDQVVDNKDHYLVGGHAVGEPHFENQKEKPPLFVYYSAHRSLALKRGSKKGKETGGAAAAYTDALDDRYLELGTQAWLWHAEQSLFESDGMPMRVNSAIERMLKRFLGEFKNLRTIDQDGTPRLFVDKGNATLDLVQLSDGEKGVLALIMDLARRLGQVHANAEFPEMEPAIVMIDELDLHLHPRWQRTISRNLLQAFPNVQFVATTHSPQILGEVPAGQVIHLVNHEIKHVWQSFGMDTNWLLKHVMHGDVRNADVNAAILEIEQDLENFNIEDAESALADLRSRIGETPDTIAMDSRIRRAEELLSQEGGDAIRQEEPVKEMDDEASADDEENGG
jgi:predicted ATP-binding protein involved in virulence